MSIETLIEQELKHFGSDAQRQAFARARVVPYQHVETWQYGPELHDCFIVARSDAAQIVYCATGFGPNFPWTAQRVGEQDLGVDSVWFAYLYEAFVCSTMWPEGPPDDFEAKGPGERAV
jgi:hypothetical protein